VIVVSLIHDGRLSSGIRRLNSSSVRRYENVVFVIVSYIFELDLKNMMYPLRFDLKEFREETTL